MRHGGGEERPNVSRSAVDNGEAARDEALSAVAGGSLSPRWKCGRLHGSECSAETEVDERLLIAVSAGNLIQPSKNRFTDMRRGSRLRAWNTFRRSLKAKQPQKFQNIP